MRRVFLAAQQAISSLGFTLADHRQAFLSNQSGIQLQNYPWGTYSVGAIDEERLKGEARKNNIPTSFSKLESIAALTINSVLSTSGIEIQPNDLLFLSSTKGNIDSICQSQDWTNSNNTLIQSAATLKKHFGWSKDPVLVCNACTSGVMAIIMAARMIQYGQIDRAVICGVDVLSEFVLRGFSALHAVDENPCRPFDVNRAGINLGEAGAAIVLTSDPTTSATIEILGAGTSNDANHISGPSRTGQGLLQAIEAAMIESENPIIDYINAHGTATLYNDEMESIAFKRAGLIDVPVNSFKGFWGHTLGAAGVIETIGAALSMESQTLYKSIGYEEQGVSHPINVISKNKKEKIAYCLKTSSGFGGSNAALIMKQLHE